MDENYDTEEASRILAKALGRTESFVERVKLARPSFLKALQHAATLAGYGAEITEDRLNVVDHVRNRGVMVRVNSIGQIQLARTSRLPSEDSWTTIDRIEFDVIGGKFVGTQQDTYRVPDPGYPWAGRAAVAVAAEAIVKFIEGLR